MKGKRLLKNSVVGVCGMYGLAMGAIALDGVTDGVRPADVAIVLGNKVERNGEPSPRLTARLDRAVALYQQGLVKQILVTGGLGKEGFDEAAVMAAFLRSRGIPGNVIIQDPKGNTTWDSAQNARALLACGTSCRAIVVSQFFHLTRTRVALEKAGFKGVGTASAQYFETRDLYSLIREVPACLSYLFRS
jgi:vancomycin permeability regulator SanA